MASKCHIFPGLWTAITPRPDLELRWGLNQYCSPQRELSNAVSHSRSARREQVDSRLLVVGSQIASLTPGPSFAHNVGCRCPNDQCEAILDIYTWRPFQWHQEHSKARCFGPYCRALNIRESRRTPTPDFSKCWASPPHLAKVGVRQNHKDSEFYPYEATFHPSTPGSTRWLCLKAQMLPVKEKCKYISKC